MRNDAWSVSIASGQIQAGEFRIRLAQTSVTGVCHKQNGIFGRLELTRPEREEAHTPHSILSQQSTAYRQYRSVSDDTIRPIMEANTSLWHKVPIGQHRENYYR